MLSSMSPVSTVSPPVRRSATLTGGAPSASSSQANLGVRTSCNYCRGKKIRCSKASAEEGGCDRCRREGIECRYDVRDPIGRPRKRKVEEGSTASTSWASTNGQYTNGHDAKSATIARRMSSASSYTHTPSPPSPPMYAHSPASFMGANGSYTNGALQKVDVVWPDQQQQEMATTTSPHGNSTTVRTYANTQQQHEPPYTPTFARPGDVQQNDPTHARSHPISPSILSQSFDESMPPTLASSSHSALTRSTAPASPIKTTSPMDAPNLADLGLAAFLESLDTLEIKREDGLTSNMLAALSAGPIGSTSDTNNASNSALTQHGNVNGNSAAVTNAAMSSSQPDWTAATHLSLANIFGSTSYAVPADLSWADPSWLDQIARPSQNSTDRSDNMPSTNPVAMLPPSWPRGAEAGMGLGELRTPDGRPIHPIPASQTTSAPQTTGENSGGDASSASCAKTGKPKCCCSSSDTGDKRGEEQVTATNHVSPQNLATPSSSASPPATTRVHCVPNPTGRGCTCLCDVSVALINVRTTLRQARGDERGVEASTSAAASAGGTASKQAASTLQLTLSASQAVTAHCACSASCPTCRTDPSTSLSASLLVSTALQIYVRAVRTLRQGFGAPDNSRSAAPSSHAASSGSDWDVSIGQYKPMATNARRIALFAMKLELRDLRDAIAKVSRAASGSSFASGSDVEAGEGVAAGATLEDEVNPIDRLVIRKLHQQLGDLLRTVEGIEEQQDAERNAISVESI